MGSLDPSWSQRLPKPAQGLRLAREAQRLLVWNDQWLAWYNIKGEIQAQKRFSSPIRDAQLSEDGTAFVVVLEDSSLHWLKSDLQTRWHHSLGSKPLAIAVDCLGVFVALSDSKGTVTVFDAEGVRFREIQSPRAVHHLGFLPISGHLLAVADLGWLAAYDFEKSDWVWRGTLFFNVAYTSLAGSGDPILIGSFTESVAAFHADGSRFEFPFKLPSSKAVRFTFDGQQLCALGRDGILRGFTLTGREFISVPESMGITHLELDGLGTRLYLCTAEGDLKAFHVDR